jgi:hypothetical protein
MDAPLSCQQLGKVPPARRLFVCPRASSHSDVIHYSGKRGHGDSKPGGRSSSNITRCVHRAALGALHVPFQGQGDTKDLGSELTSKEDCEKMMQISGWSKFIIWTDLFYFVSSIPQVGVIQMMNRFFITTASYMQEDSRIEHISDKFSDFQVT